MRHQGSVRALAQPQPSITTGQTQIRGRQLTEDMHASLAPDGSSSHILLVVLLQCGLL